MHTAVKDVKNFIHFAAKELGLTSLPTIHLVGSEENPRQSFGHFLGTRSGKQSITVRITDRHPIDVMRTLAHELIHYQQKQKGMRASEQMKEDQANAMAGRIMRKFNSANPKVFGHKPVLEDAMGAANFMGASSSTPGTGGIDTVDPLLQFKTKKKKLELSIFRRKAPVSENILTKTIANHMTDRSSISKGKPKKLRDIITHDEKNDKRADTRIS